MLVREAMQARLCGAAFGEAAGPEVQLPRRLTPDRTGVRLAVLQRLGASRLLAAGDRAGVLRSAQTRSGRAFRLNVRQRVVVKARVSRHAGRGAARAAGLAAHVAYLGRTGAGAAGTRPQFFDRSRAELDPAQATAGWAEDRHHFRFIVSPEHGDRIADLAAYTRDVLQRVAADLGQPALEWIATCHFDTDQPHAHVLARGRRADGRDLVIPRDYIAYGFRARAQEAAQERLGDLSRIDAERRVWRETQADRFTGLDRRLLQAADREGRVPDGMGGGDAWSALTRGRLRRLESLGLATREGQRFRLDADLEAKLRGLQLRQDVIGTLHRRRLETGRAVRELGGDRVRGRVVGRGAHDELAARAWVIVQDAAGVEHYADLGPKPAPALGRTVELVPGGRGATALEIGRGVARGD